MKPPALLCLQRTRRVKIPPRAHVLGLVWRPERTSAPHPPVRPDVITRRLARSVPGEGLRGPLRWPRLQTAPSSALSSRVHGRWLRGAALSESPQWEMFPAFIRRSQMTRFSSRQTLALPPPPPPQPAFHASLVWCCGAFGGKMFWPHRTFSFLGGGFSMPPFRKVSPAHRAPCVTF